MIDSAQQLFEILSTMTEETRRKARVIVIDIKGQDWSIAETWITLTGDTFNIEVMRRRTKGY